MTHNHDSHKRSLLKTLSWYACHLTVATGAAWVITGSAKMAGTIASFEIIWESGLFYGHERLWSKIRKK